MLRKILLSVLVVGAVGGAAIAATNAFFSDTETSTGNTFTAGDLDLKVDSQCTYNGNVIPGCTWIAKDLTRDDLFFNFTDVKPGDFGEDTVSLHVNTNDAYICAQIANTNSVERGCNGPEALVDSTCTGDGVGELQDYLLFTIWKDNGAGTNSCNNKLDADETALVTDQKLANGIWPIADSQTGGPLAGNTDACLGVSWRIPPETGNIIQGDMVTADIKFTAMQSRNNPDFRCASTTQVSDYLDIGNVTSEAGHNVSTANWSDPWVNPGWGGNYGGGSSDTSLRLLMGKGDSQGCADPAARPATFTMNAGSGTATKLTLEHLDGAVNDSFEVFINGVSAGTYLATSTGGTEVWKTTTFTFPGVTGTVNVQLYATHPVASWCADWGQVGFSNAKLE